MLLVCMLGLPTTALQAGRGATLPVAHGAVIRDFARITFEWPDPTYFTATTEGNTVTISFDRQADPYFGSLLKALHPYVKHATRQPDGRTVVLTLDKPYRIRTFVSDNINGIDLLQVNAGKQRKYAEPRLKKTKTAQAHPADARQLAALAPAAGEAEATAQAPVEKPAAETTPEPEKTEPAKTEEKPAEPPPAKEAVAPPAAPATAKAPETETPPTQENAVVQQPATKPQPEAEVPVPLSYSSNDSQTNSDYLKIGLSAQGDSAVLRLPLNERAALAAFKRGRKMWLLISKSYKVDVSDFKDETKTVISHPEIIPSAKSTILRFDVDEAMQISTTKETSSYNWGILLTAQKRPLHNILLPAIRTDPPARPHLFIPVLEMADPIAIHDPQVGDEMVVVPLFHEGEGVANTKDFVEFTLMETGQGVVVLKKADGVDVALLRDGMRVTVSENGTLTPGLPMVEIKNQQEKLIQTSTLFPYAQWRIPDNEVSEEIRKLFQESVKNTDAKKANDARLQMAKIYMAQGMAVEALGLLDIIREKDPGYFRSQKLAALRGAADFIMYRYADASRDFASGELDNSKEIDFWRKVVADLLGNPDQNYNFMELNDDYISKYPPEMRRRLVIVAADKAISDKEYNAALKIIESMSDPELVEPVKDYIRFLMASIAAGTGQEAEALDVWDKLADNYDEPFIRASAELSRIMWGMAHDELTTQQVVERLEHLRLSWHGDRLELQVIKELGKIYEDKKDYVNAMRIWHGGITSFPNSSLAVEMKQKMQQAFNFMFSEGGVDELPPLDVLAMYYEYQNYAPSGTTGAELIEKLSKRLIAIDLLQQAADLLDSQMRHIAEKEQRSQMGAKLAEVYLLNNQPQKALEALQDSLYGENSLLLRLVRNRLAAEAMVDQDRLRSALQVLGQDTSTEAERIRLNIYWKQRNWDKVVSSVEGLLKERPDITAQVTLDEAEALLKLALAYVFENNDIQLKYLRDYYMPLMKNNPYREVFDYVTRGEMVITTTNFDEVIKNLSDTRDFIEKYNTRIKIAGTSDDDSLKTTKE